MTTHLPSLTVMFAGFLLLQTPLAANDLVTIPAQQWTTVRQDLPDEVADRKALLDARSCSWVVNDPKISKVVTVPLVQFDPSEFSTNRPLKSAKVRLKVYDPNGKRAERPIFRICPVVTEWDSSSVTWETRPEWDDAFADCEFNPKENTDDEYEEYDVTPIVQKWLDGSITNHGLAIVAQPEQGNFSQILFFPKPTLVLEN